MAMASASLSSAGRGVSAAVEALCCNILRRGSDVWAFGLADSQQRMSERGHWSGGSATSCRIFGPRALGYAPDMAQRLIEWNPDIVHSHGLWMHTARSVLQWSRATGRPYLVSPHGMLAPAALAFSSRKKMIAMELYQRAALLRASCFHATSEAELLDIRRFGLKQPIAVVANGVDLPDSADVLERALPPSVLALGRIHPIKGLDRLLRAWAEVWREHPDWSLRIVGPDEAGHSAELQQLISQLGLQNISISGAVCGREKSALLREAELFVLPSLSENFAMTVGESLSYGTPVIATKGAPWGGLVTNRCGWWIDHGPEAMAAALKEAMSLPCEQRHAMGARGRAWMKRDFTWDSIAAQMMQVYSWLVGASDRPSSVVVD